MTKSKVMQIHREMGERLSLVCNEHHKHFVTKGCYTAKDKKDLIICELCEYIYGLLEKIRRATECLKGT